MPENFPSEERRMTTRRSLFKWTAGAGVAAVALATGPDLNLSKAFAQRGAGGAVNLGSGDVGILNYAYALEQLEAAYYTTVLARPYAGMSRREHSLLSDIRNHEVAHRDFLRHALGGMPFRACRSISRRWTSPAWQAC